MNSSCSKLLITFFIFCVISLTFLTNTCTSNSQLSGSVKDTDGKPVDGFSLSLYMTDKLNNRRSMPIEHQNVQQIFNTDTDKTGHFKFADFDPKRNMILKFNEGRGTAAFELSGIKIEGITLFGNIHRIRFDGFRFTIPKNTNINSLEITVKRRITLRGQVVSSNDNPLRNATVRMEVFEGGNRRSSGSTNLDNEGKFVQYLTRPGNYSFKIQYQGLSVESKPILVEEGQEIDNLVLKLTHSPDGNNLQQQKRAEIIRNQPGAPPPNMRAFMNLMEQGVWAINPENRHAYKKVKCTSFQEAKTMATEENAHVLSIKDEAEQHWVLEVFGDTNYWIGLVAGEKTWDNGEPLTYSNWISEPEQNEKESDIKYHTILIGKSRQWDVGIPDSPITKITEYTILEKEIYNPEDLVTEIDDENQIRR
ncbi:hypothetical protein C6497_01900 [Candidatus Poribacteria bacterium]|nr:MAG: hypothetical protein C6497_01900 [Candidatus Poribacteria bacterium]